MLEKLADDELMQKCHKLRREGLRWKQICEVLEIDMDRQRSLTSTYSKWRNQSKIARTKRPGKVVFDEDEFTEMVNIMSQAFKEITVEAEFKMQLPKRLVDIQELLLEEIKATRIAMEKMGNVAQKIEDLERSVRIMKENNMPLGRRKREWGHD